MTLVNIKNIQKGFMPLLFLLAFVSCKKESNDIGVNLLPNQGIIDSDLFNLNTITCRTIEEDSLRSDSLSTNIIGAIKDPLFGDRIASLTIQPQLPEFGMDFTGKIIDSVVLILKHERYQVSEGVLHEIKYGDMSSTNKIDVYSLNEDLDSDAKYYTNYKPSLGSLVGSFSGQFNIADSVTTIFENDTFQGAPELRIVLNNTFGQSILDQPTTVFESQENFLDFLKGLVLVPDETILGSNGGSIVALNATGGNSSLKVYYDGTESLEMIFTSSSEHISSYEIKSIPAAITNQVSGSGHFNTTYLQAMSGHKLRIDLPQLDSLIQDGEDVVINEAAITFEVDASAVSTDLSVPVRLLLAIPSKVDGKNAPIQDFIDDAAPPAFDWLGNTNYGGRYNASTNQYVFRFNRYLQELITDYNNTGVNNFDGFYLTIPSDFPIIPYRTVLNTDPNLGSVKVSVAYTKLN